MCVSQETPNLLESHGERLFALVNLDLSRVDLVPLFHLRIVAEKAVLNLLENVLRVFFQLHQVVNADQLLEGVLFNFFLRFAVLEHVFGRCTKTSLGVLDRSSGNACSLSRSRFSLLLCRFGISLLGVLGFLLNLFSSHLLEFLGLLGVNFSFHHPVVLERTVVLSTFFKSENTSSVFEVLDPVAFILATVGVVEHSSAMSLTELPVAHIPVTQQLVLGGSIKPDMGTKTTLEVVFPIALVLLLAGEPVHTALTVTLIVGPLSFIKVAACIGHLALAPLHSSFPLAFVHGSILVGEDALTVAHSIDPGSHVLDAFRLVDVLSNAVSEAISHLSLVSRLIRPGVFPRARNLVGGELALVDSAVGPAKLTLSMQQTVFKFSFVGMAIAELACALSVVDFADLYKKA